VEIFLSLWLVRPVILGDIYEAYRFFRGRYIEWQRWSQNHNMMDLEGLQPSSKIVNLGEAARNRPVAVCEPSTFRGVEWTCKICANLNTEFDITKKKRIDHANRG
jgi:hypothetical protein